ncbi:type II toxin-antitoxin system RatA family toxin [Alterisphingorhabdus coralli]|uniref:Type II toxin-antitoxin system RatA family toxin n=1 Tax=Alterisphingorhabdus coralli TaxID=3071408 RepID=A0AA97HZ01_9SPHN|nr:type II toxin-antitoxin system RatA family toxin [Parasphingorhabdus sp. SCSIO 66989]WOE74059.1 type II toxin-antitoxin system RatA family toxin [Parasphingorhabdus sp. SCSIO 66989]
MPTHSETRYLPYTPEQVYALVADVDSYEDFLPWVIGTRIRSDSDTEMVADMIVGFKQLRERFTSHVTKVLNEAIIVEYLDGPLRNLENKWNFAPHGDGQCRVDFFVSFNFHNRFFERLAGQYFDKAFRKMVAAFEDRADQLYGRKSSSAHNAA